MERRRIIVGDDGREGGADALALAARLAAPLDAEPLPVQVCSRDREPTPRSEETRLVRCSSPADALERVAASEHGVAIVVGASRSAIRGQVLAGGVAQQLLRGSRLPVAVAPMGFAAEEPSDLRVLAVAYNGSAESELALEVAAEMALRVGATLRVLAVDEPLRGAGFAAVATGYVESTREWLRQRLQEATGALPSSLRAQAVLLDGEAAAAIAAQAELGVDLLVTGSRAHGALGRVLLGSTSSKLMRTAPCPVLAVPRPAEPRGASAGGGFAPASARLA